MEELEERIESQIDSVRSQIDAYEELLDEKDREIEQLVKERKHYQDIEEILLDILVSIRKSTMNQ